MNILYKGFDENLKCRDFQFEIGKTYFHDGLVRVCESGFHACENPWDVLRYYPLTDSRYCVVEQSGEIHRHGGDSKIASSSITISTELKLPEFVKTCVDWLIKTCSADAEVDSGYASRLAASGDGSQLAASGYASRLAASGYGSRLAASGNNSRLAASGDGSHLAASGDYSRLAASGAYSRLAASGDGSQLAASGDASRLAASGSNSLVMGAYNGRAKAGPNGAIALAWYDGTRPRIAVGYVGETLKADTWYRLDEKGTFVEDGK